MEKELNIAAILKDKPVGTKLWTDMFGEVTLYVVTEACNRFQVKHHNKEPWFEKDGRLYEEGSLCIYPSRNMRDWSKFAWKKGDVLEYTEGEEPYYAIFEAFQDNEYTAFKSRYNFNGGNHWLQFNSQSSTNHFTKVSDEEAKAFIEKVEEHYCGKLNLETLEIEKPKFKDGDIVFVKARIYDGCYSESVFILKNETEEAIYKYAGLFLKSEDLVFDIDIPMIYKFNINTIRLATDSEKKQLFDALEKEGKRWNAETKTLEDLPKKCEFNPMDWCLMRIKGDCWKLCQFGFKGEDKEDPGFNAIGGSWFDECIPYNDKTAHLLGTNDDWKGGEE